MHEFPTPSGAKDNGQLKNQYFASYEVISNVQELIGSTEDWEVPRNYPDTLLAIVKYLPETTATQSLRSFVLEAQDTKGSMAHAREAVSNLLATLPLEGTKILEIGGPFGQVLHAMGAEVFCVDPDIEGMSYVHKVSWKYTPTKRNELYHPVAVRLTATNWQEFIAPGQFDFVYSRWVLSKNSGSSSDWIRQWDRDYPANRDQYTMYWTDAYTRRREAYHRVVKENEPAEIQARADLFAISAAVTKKGGFILHQGDAIEELIPLSMSNELDYVETRYSGGRTIDPSWWECPVYVFRKL